MSEDIEATLGDLQHRIDRLRVLYEQYFIGIEKSEPTVPRKQVVRIFADLQQIQIRNTALRFRHNALMQRWNTYVTRWGKTLREIELGTYDRHVARAQRKGIELPPEIANRKPGSSGKGLKVAPAVETPVAPPPEPKLDSLDSLDGLLEELDDGGDFVFESRATALGARVGGEARPDGRPRIVTPPPFPVATPRAPKVTPPPTPPPNAITVARPLPPTARAALDVLPGMDETAVRALHQRYSEARRATGSSEVKYEALVATLKKQVPDLLAKHQCAGVTFDVTVRDGKPILKAKPKK